jgi:hypothetical protein
MEVPESVALGLRNIRSGLHLRWNVAAVKRPTGFDATGKPLEMEVEPRFELWDTDPQGQDYMVMRVQNEDGSFRFPDDRLVERMGRLNPERYGGNVHRMLQAQVDDPETLRELGTQKDTDDLIESVVKWAEWYGTVKSAAGLTYRGSRLFS